MSSALPRLLGRASPVHIRWGLERTESMLAALGEPHCGPQIVHIGGTNGKGTVAACAESVLRIGGRRTGLYTSPHLVRFAERIRIDGEPAGEELLESCASRVLPLAEREGATFFEAATVLALEAFRQAGCDTLVLEVGLGGRLDSTNVVDPDVTVITAVDLDHADYLGDTVEAIAAEKAGIIKPGVPLVAGPLLPGPRAVVEARAREVGSPLELLGRDFTTSGAVVSLDGTRFEYRSPDTHGAESLRIGLVGRHQADNAALAVRAVELLSPAIERESVRVGLDVARWPGRFEIVRDASGTWVLDIAHNTAAAERLAHLLAELDLPRPIVVLAAILGDKPWRDMLGPLLGAAEAGVFTVAPSSPPERRWSPEAALDELAGSNAEVIYGFPAALDRARELAGAGTVVVTGSAHTVGDAMKYRLR